MRYSLLLVCIAGLALGAAALNSDADQHKGASQQEQSQEQSHARQQDMDRLHDKERIQEQEQERIRLKDEEIFGYKLMSPEELNRYRERIRMMKTEEERHRFEAQHREEMQKRAQALNVKIEDAE